MQNMAKSNIQKKRYNIYQLLTEKTKNHFGDVNYGPNEFNEKYIFYKKQLAEYLGLDISTINRDIALTAGEDKAIPRTRLIAYAKYFDCEPSAVERTTPKTKKTLAHEKK